MHACIDIETWKARCSATSIHTCIHTYIHTCIDIETWKVRRPVVQPAYIHTYIHTRIDIETWKVRRPVVQPGFHAQWLKRMCVTFNECAQVMYVCMYVCMHICMCYFQCMCTGTNVCMRR